MSEKKIVSMPYKGGNKKESSWPPARKSKGFRGSWYIDPDTKELKRGLPQRKGSQTHFVLNDEIPPTESMATDKREVFTSRSKLNEHYRKHGFECTGGEHLKDVKPPKHDPEKQLAEVREDAERAYYDIKYDRAPFTEYEKELCRKEENAFQAYKKRQ